MMKTSTHGGARRGAGRKPGRRKTARLRRVLISATVAPETDARINAKAAAMGVSIGRALDALLAVKVNVKP